MAEKRYAEGEAIPRFKKDILAASAKYADRKDLIGALLDPDTEYTLTQVDEMIEKYLNGRVI
mgnify:FL=1